MMKSAITQSQKRFQESMGALFSSEDPECIFLKSSTDTGVIRNGGRNGARFAPKSFLSTFKKFSQHIDLKSRSFLEVEVSDQALEEKNFHESQDLECEKIKEVVKKHPRARFIHLGGGHDHIYPFLMALSSSAKKVIVVNIDAHADTRTDENFHSGTPFRQFSEKYAGEFSLYQIGLHPFANSFSTLSPLQKGESDVLWKRDLDGETTKNFFSKISQQIDLETLVVFSLDADALSGFEVPGVSAVNPMGLSHEELRQCWDEYLNLPLSHAPILGIYELNPIYDTLASISMRVLGSFVFQTFLDLEKR
jgi:formiminoglutamase